MLTPETNSSGKPKVVSTAQYLRKKEEQEQKSDRRKNIPQNQQFFHILESITDGFFALDGQWRFIYVNHRAERILLKSRQDLIGQIIWDEFPELVGSHFEREYRQAVEQNTPVHFESYYPHLGLWVEVRAFPTEDGLAVYFVDITKYKKTEAALRQSEIRNQAFLQVIPDLLFRLNQQGDYLDVSAANPDQLLLPIREVIGKNLRDTLPEAVAKTTLDRLQKALETNKIQVFEFSLPLNQTPRMYEARIVKSGENEAIIIVRDITERQAIEEARKQNETKLREQAQQLEITLHQLQTTQTQLVQHEKMSSLGQLVAGIAHEINNPINFIYGNLNYANTYAREILTLLKLYERHYPEPAAEIHNLAQDIDIEFILSDFPNLIESMRVGAERIRQIVLSLRNFSRLDEDGLKSSDLHEGLDNTLLILQHRLKRKDNHPGIQVIQNYSQLPSVECFPGQLNQVFMNLLCNAIDALEEKFDFSCLSPSEPLPTIWINTQVLTRHSKVAIAIRDNGIGMDRSAINRLFDPFFTTKPVGKGTGLGLSISYQIIVNHHRGQLSCNSEPGIGSEFVIELPIFRRH